MRGRASSPANGFLSAMGDPSKAAPLRVEATFLPGAGLPFVMNVKPMLAALLLAATALAGCADGNDGGAPRNTTTGTTTATPPANASDPTPNIAHVLVGTEAAYPPFEDIVDGEIVGFDMDVMREIASRAGFTVEFQNAEFTAIIPSVQSGQFHAGMSSFTITTERREQVDFSVPYYENSLMAAVPAATEGVAAPEDLDGKRVCTQEGTTSEFYLREELGFTDADLMLLDSAPLCAEAVKNGDADALMIDAAFVRTVIESSGGELKQAFVIEDVDEEFGIAVKKGNIELLNAINTALNAMKADGTLQELVDEWQV